MLQIVQAYDRSPIAQVATDDADALEAKLDLAVRAFRERGARDASGSDAPDRPLGRRGGADLPPLGPRHGRWHPGCGGVL